MGDFSRDDKILAGALYFGAFIAICNESAVGFLLSAAGIFWISHHNNV